jgi:tetratricopeptide (TPR) repeat protein
LERVVQAGIHGEARIELGKLYGVKALEAEDEEGKRSYLAQSERHFDVAQQVQGSEAEAFLRHGQTLVRVLEFEKAVPLLQRALELKPNEKVKEYFLRVERAAERQQKARERETDLKQGMADAS